jgi:hypothetical protein
LYRRQSGTRIVRQCEDGRKEAQRTQKSERKSLAMKPSGSAASFSSFLAFFAPFCG